jgi:hypothetical protein
MQHYMLQLPGTVGCSAEPTNQPALALLLRAGLTTRPSVLRQGRMPRGPLTLGSSYPRPAACRHHAVRAARSPAAGWPRGAGGAAAGLHPWSSRCALRSTSILLRTVGVRIGSNTTDSGSPRGTRGAAPGLCVGSRVRAAPAPCAWLAGAARCCAAVFCIHSCWRLGQQAASNNRHGMHPDGSGAASARAI